MTGDADAAMLHSLQQHRAWWEHAVVYSLYPRSFSDSDGDGIGDLPGLLSRLDHLAWLGVDAVWLTPVMPSPNCDWGYDVSDYTNIHPDLGTLDDLDRLVAAARDRGIRVLLDLVPNHTSSAHPWFVDSRTSRTSALREWYVWSDPLPDGRPPNNWLSHFGGPAWTLDEATSQMYLHNFTPWQPDLNWWNPAVRDEFVKIIRFWFDRGIAGFRIDVCHGIVKDAALRDNPAATATDPPHVVHGGLRFHYNENRPEVHELLRSWRRIADSYGESRVLLGETFAPDADALGAFYGDGDELHLALNVPFLAAGLEAAALRTIVEGTEAALPSSATPTWTLSAHDLPRVLTRSGAPPQAAACALMLLLTLRGTAVLYYGDEIGMCDTEVPPQQRRDPVGRDSCRTPMLWKAAPHAGFTSAPATPWLPVGDSAACNVADQRADPGSALHLTRDLIALRRRVPGLASGDCRTLDAPAGVFAFTRGESIVVALNLGDAPCEVRTGRARIVVGTDRRRDGEICDGLLSLGAWEGAILDTQPPPHTTMRT